MTRLSGRLQNMENLQPDLNDLGPELVWSKRTEGEI